MHPGDLKQVTYPLWLQGPLLRLGRSPGRREEGELTDQPRMSPSYPPAVHARVLQTLQAPEALFPWDLRTGF